jgi:hypothetical protein
MPINYGTHNVSTSGNLTTASGIILTNNAPSTTTDTLYNDNGVLKFNGSSIGGGGGSYNKSYASTLMFG